MSTVAALVPAYNEQATIGATVRSLLAEGVADVLVVANNCTDFTALVAHHAGARVITMQDNADKKAGALNAGLPHVSKPYVIVMDADTEIGPGYVKTALARFAADPEIGAVGGSFHPRSEANILQRMQGNEYQRYVREISRRKGARANVLTGAGSMFRLNVLKEVEAHRSADLLPGNGVYRQDALTEDNELSLAVMTLGYKIVSPKACEIRTDCPDTVAALFAQRVRWRRGAMEDLARYGLTRVTAPYLAKMLWSLFVTVLSVVYVGLLFTIDEWGWSPFWLAVLGVCVVDKWWTIRNRDWRSQMLALLVIPEVIYDLFQQVVLARAVWDFGRRAPEKW